MALDSKLKRGSVTTIGLPFRPWVGEPDGTIGAVDRAGVAKLSASIAPAAPTTGGAKSLRPGLTVAL